jgi:transcriptional regulator with XRE-family HTH domain
MKNGYSVHIADAIQRGDSNHLGVKLGLACIETGLPVMQVASRLGVSRQTVYNWFLGKLDPSNGPFCGAVTRLLDELS